MAQVLVNIQLMQASHLQALKICIFHDIFLDLTTQEASVHVRWVSDSDMVLMMSLVFVHALPDLGAKDLKYSRVAGRTAGCQE